MANNTISKVIAESIARQLVAKFDIEYNNLSEEIVNYLKPLVLKTIPTEVAELYKKYPQNFKTIRTVILNSNGFHNDSVSFKEPIPIPPNFNYCEYVYDKDLLLPNGKPALSKDNYTHLWKLWEKRKSIAEKKETTRKEICNTLLTLKSYKRIQEHFPEIASYLPTSTQTMALTLNLDKIRETTKCLISEDSKCMKEI